MSGKSKGGLSKGGLGPKGANWAKKGPFGAISALPPWLWGAEELVPIGPEKAPIGPEKVPICPEKARFRRKDFPPIFSENLGLKPPFVSPPLDFPNHVKRKALPFLILGQKPGHTPRGSYSRKGVLLPSRRLLESPFLEPLLRTLLRTLAPIKTHCKTPSKNPS